jgi:hypothetical protein
VNQRETTADALRVLGKWFTNGRMRITWMETAEAKRNKMSHPAHFSMRFTSFLNAPLEKAAIGQTCAPKVLSRSA